MDLNYSMSEIHKAYLTSMVIFISSLLVVGLEETDVILNTILKDRNRDPRAQKTAQVFLILKSSRKCIENRCFGQIICL